MCTEVSFCMVVEVDSGGRDNRYKTKEGKQNTVSGRGAVDRTLICAGGISLLER